MIRTVREMIPTGDGVVVREQQSEGGEILRSRSRAFSIELATFILLDLTQEELHGFEERMRSPRVFDEDGA